MTNPPETADAIIALVRDECRQYDATGKRIVANRVAAAIADWLPPSSPSPAPALEPLTDAESRRIGAETMEFGMHAGKRIDEVDLDYLAWLADASRATWRKLTQYLQSQRIRSE